MNLMNDNFKKGIKCYKNKDFSNAMIFFLQSFDDPFSIFMLGYMYDKGIYVMQNEEKANKYYTKFDINTFDMDRINLHNLLISNYEIKDTEEIYGLAHKFTNSIIKVFLYEICYEFNSSISVILKIVYHSSLIKDIKKSNHYLKLACEYIKESELFTELLFTSKRHLKSCQYAKWLEILLNSCLFQNKKHYSLITGIIVELLDESNMKCSIRLFYKFALMGFEDGMKKLENQYIMAKPESFYYKAKIYQMGYRIRRVDNKKSIFYLESAWKNSKNIKIKKELCAIKIKLKLLEQTKISKFCDIIIK